MNSNTYTIAIATRHEEHGGTNADIFVSIVGEFGSIPYQSLDHPDYDDFEQGNVDLFPIIINQWLGNIVEVKLYLVFKGNDPEWKPGYIIVAHDFIYDNPKGGDWAGNNSWYFDCRQEFITQENVTHSYTTQDFWPQEHDGPPTGVPSQPPPPPPPDQPKTVTEIAITDLVLDPTVYPAPGQAFDGVCTIINAGNAEAKDLSVEFSLFHSSPPSGDAVKLGSPKITLGPSVVGYVHQPFPDGLPAGKYSLVAVADPDNKLEEISKENNGTYIGFSVEDSIGEPQSAPSWGPPKDLEVAWTGRKNGSPHRRGGKITRVGGMSEGNPWSMTVDEAIDAIASGRHNLFVRGHGGHKVTVEIEHRSGRHPYLRSRPDADPENNLYDLPTAPNYFSKLQLARRDRHYARE